MHPACRLLPCVLILAACGPAGQAPVRAEPSAAQPPTPEQPAPIAATPAPAAAAAPAGPVDERFAATRDGWRVDYHLALPALAAAQARPLRIACMAWLFQGVVTPRANVTDSGEAALATLIADGGKPTGSDPWYSERAVVATHVGGGWLALRRSEHSFAGGAHDNSRTESLIVELDGVRALTLDEVIPPERQADLRLVLARELRRGRGLPADGPLTSEIAKDADLPIPVPLIEDGGARFLWNPYEIGPFSDGAYEVKLPADQVRSVLAVDPWPKP